MSAAPRVDVVIDDIVFAEGDAIARPVNAELGATTPLLRRLETAAGDALSRQLTLSEPLAVGSAVVTGAGELSVGLLIHAVVSSDSERVTASSVRRATLSALQRAADWRVSKLAIPPFGLGAGNLEPETSAEVMADALREHFTRAALPARVLVVVENEDERAAFCACLTSIAA
jgi:O-acetyl-ADP-ribose deacetylase (regulator of RNase III)